MSDPSRQDLLEAKAEFEERIFDSVCLAHADSTGEQRTAPMDALATHWLNLVGVGLGFKVTKDGFTLTPSIVVSVQRKIARKKLHWRRRIPPEIGGIPTDVVEVGLVRAISEPPSVNECLVDPATRVSRPFPAGVSIGGGKNPAGSVGYPVRLRGRTGSYLLSNYHILGDLKNHDARPVTLQPGWGDGPSPSDEVGRFETGQPILFDGPPNEMDAAIARARPKTVLPFLCSIGRLNGVSEPEDEGTVFAYGKRSKHSKGLVREVALDVWVRYRGKRRAFFKNQIKIVPATSNQPFARHGDSGTLAIKKDKTACALIFAASSTSGAAMATPLPRVLRALDARLE